MTDHLFYLPRAGRLVIIARETFAEALAALEEQFGDEAEEAELKNQILRPKGYDAHARF